MSNYQIPSSESDILRSLGFKETYSDETSLKWKYKDPVYIDPDDEVGLVLGRNYSVEVPNGKFWAGRKNEDGSLEFLRSYDEIRELGIAKAYYEARDSSTPISEFNTPKDAPPTPNTQEETGPIQAVMDENPNPSEEQDDMDRLAHLAKKYIDDTKTKRKYTDEERDLIRNTVAKGASDANFGRFIYLAEKYDLDPLVNEIWCTTYTEKTGRVVTDILTGRDGYLKIAQNNSNYEGLMSGVVKVGDEFEFKPCDKKSPVMHKFGTDRGAIIGAWAVCFYKDRAPYVAFADFSEYNKGKKFWVSYPSAMIKKVAEAMALKIQFGISGLVTKEEIEE
ncbi:MAG: phage recombination protein Bet [Halobacteriota archaeon]|nr:phage recombination protein Bet [Halobacteriota archaeon]